MATMKANAQTNASDLLPLLNSILTSSKIKPLSLIRIEEEAKKLLKTEDAYFGYLCLACHAAFDDRDNLTNQERFVNVQRYLDQASQCYGCDPKIYFQIYYLIFAKLGMFSQLYPVVEECADSLLDDNIEGLTECLKFTMATGQMSLSEQILAKLNKLEKGDDRFQYRSVPKQVISESDARALLLEARKLVYTLGLFERGVHHEYDEPDFFHTIILLADSDEKLAAECDIELSRLKIRFAQEHGLDLSRFILGCEIESRES